MEQGLEIAGGQGRESIRDTRNWRNTLMRNCRVHAGLVGLKPYYMVLWLEC